MPLTTSHFTLNTATPTQLCPPDVQPQTVWIHNEEHAQADKIYIGNSSVSIANGLHVHSDQTLKIDLDPGTSLWAISDTVGSIVHVMCIKQD